MSEFKFSCPNCQQNIQATPEYSGLQINCPSCQTPLIVPQAPGASPPPVPGARLSMAASTPNPAVPAPTVYTKPPVRIKKSKAGPIIGWSVAACAVAALIIFGPAAAKKYGLFKSGPTAEEKATNNAPPPPPPELTTQEILQKVSDAYKNMTDYTATARTVAELDISSALGGKGPTTSTGSGMTMNLNVRSSLEVGRTNLYRLEWEPPGLTGQKVTLAAWNAGSGDYVGTSPAAARKVKSREEAWAAANASMVLSTGVAETFFSTTNSIIDKSGEFTKTNSPSFNGQDSYVLLGEVEHKNFVVWINKKSFLITQVQLVLDGKVNEAELKELKKLPAMQQKAAMAYAQMKGTITETYDNILTNQQLAASAFAMPIKPAANPGAGPQRTPFRGGPSPTPGRRTRQQ